MTQEEKYINFLLNNNKKLQERNTDWLGPEDMGDVILETAQQNDPGCIQKIMADYDAMKQM